MELESSTSIDTIWIVTDTPSAVEVDPAQRGVGYRSTWGDEVQSTTMPPSTSKGVPVSAHKLEAEMTRLLDTVGRVFDRADRQSISPSGLQLQEVELAIEISAEGQVYLIGNGGKAAGKGAITLKFTRPNQHS